MMLGPLSARAERYNIPSLVSAIILWLLVIGVFYGVIALLAPQSSNGSVKHQILAATFKKSCMCSIVHSLSLQELRDVLLPSDKKGNLGVDIISFVQPALLIVTPAIGQTFIFFGTLFFMLLGRSAAAPCGGGLL